MKEIYKTTTQLLKKSWKQLFIFETVYKILTASIIMPLIDFIFDMLLTKTNSGYLTNSNIIEAINPIFIIGMIFILIIITIYFFIEIGCIILILKNNYYGKKSTIFSSIKEVFKKAKKVFKIKNLWLVFFSILIVPLTNVFISSGLIPYISIPEFIMDAINNNSLFSIVFYGLMLFFTILTFFYMFIYNGFFAEGKSATEAAKESFNLLKNRKWRTIKSLVFMSIILNLIYFLFIIVNEFIVNNILSITNHNNLYYYYIAIYLIIQWAVSILLSIFSISIGYCRITYLYYTYKKEDGTFNNELINNIEIENNNKKPINKWLALTIFVICIIILIFYIFISKLYLQYNDLPKNEEIENITISAHRGGGNYAPENTIPAFQAGIDSGSDFCELDVQLSKDGALIITHDSNFKRLTGVDKNVWEMTLAEIKELDAGSSFDEKYKDTRIATLEEVIEYCKGKVKLNIEIKRNGHDEGLEKKVIDTIHKYDFQNSCVVTSLDYEALKEVRKLDPNLKIGYLMAIAQGEFYNLDVDFYGIETTNVNDYVSFRLHTINKDISVWTVNSEEAVLNILDDDIDNIITDEPIMVKELLHRENNWIRTLLQRN